MAGKAGPSAGQQLTYGGCSMPDQPALCAAGSVYNEDSPCIHAQAEFPVTRALGKTCGRDTMDAGIGEDLRRRCNLAVIRRD